MKPVFPFILFILISLGSLNVQAQGYIHADGVQIKDGSGNPVLLRGMGLGGWMLQEGYMMGTAGVANTQHEIIEKLTALMGANNTTAFYTAWRANHVTKRDIDSLKAWGFNSVRLPMHYNLFTLPIQAEPVPGQNTWLTTGFQLTDSLLSWCAQNQMYLILDLHAAPGGQGMDAAISDYDSDLPSLWESFENKNKTVALWKKIADRYKNEPWIGGYDLLNEVNWNLPGNTDLRSLYVQITQAIRQVDQNHMIIIEGNWFANDFTGLTPPWDDNMAYSFHRYWAYNTKETIQGYLNMRQTYQVPLWMGEAGENSNVWFRDCISLLEKNNIGWAWWPMKKVSNISNPYSIIKNDGYQQILNYWNNQGPQPTAATANLFMQQLAENAKSQNCRYSRDVVDSWIRQVSTDTAKPYLVSAIPGVVYAVDYDLGTNGVAYRDAVVADYKVSSGTFTAWNNGFIYRNDGVDIEATPDPMNARGHNIGWTEDGEWLQYSVQVATTGAYQVQTRVATSLSSCKFHLELDGADIAPKMQINSTGGYQVWQNNIQPGVVLEQGSHKLRLYVDKGGFNVGSIGFSLTGTTASVPCVFLSAQTVDYHTIEVNLNKLLAPLGTPVQGFRMYVNGVEKNITQVQLSGGNAKLVHLTTSTELHAGDVITVSYAGSAVLAQDATVLQNFTLQPVTNTLLPLLLIPGRIQAEAYSFQEGIQLENTTDTGGGQNIGYCDVGDYWDYEVFVQEKGIYQAVFRVASTGSTGKMNVQLWDSLTQTYLPLTTVSVPNTNGWQTWTSISSQLTLPKGAQKLRFSVAGPLFNHNWTEYTFLTALDKVDPEKDFSVYPNPSTGKIQLSFSKVTGQKGVVSLLNLAGQELMRQPITVTQETETLDLSHMAAGTYILRVQYAEGEVVSRKVTIRD